MLNSPAKNCSGHTYPISVVSRFSIINKSHHVRNVSNHLNGFVETSVLHKRGTGLRQLDLACRILGDGCLEQGVSGGDVGGLTQSPPDEAYNGGPEKDKHPGVNDGVDREETQSYKICSLATKGLGDSGIDVYTDLQKKEERSFRNIYIYHMPSIFILFINIIN